MSLFSSYPPPYIISPALPNAHQTTLILLHGTSTTGPEFATSFLPFIFFRYHSNKLTTLQEALPRTRFVFPTGKPRKTTVFGGRETNAWFDVSSFNDRTIGEDAMREGVGESLAYLARIIEDEIKLLELKSTSKKDGQGRARVVLGGFSQGCAMGIMVILSQVLETRGLGKEIGGFIGLSGWCPFRIVLEESLLSVVVDENTSIGEVYQRKRERVASDLRKLIDMESDDNGTAENYGTQGFLGRKILLLHGEGDAKMKIEWGAQAREFLKGLGGNVSWKSYKGLEHWYSEEEMRDLVGYLEGVWGSIQIGG